MPLLLDLKVRKDLLELTELMELLELLELLADFLPLLKLPQLALGLLLTILVTDQMYLLLILQALK
jgi:hypothetical protein